MKKKIFSLMLAVMMLVSAIPSAYAAGTLIKCPNACVSGGSEVFLANCPTCQSEMSWCYLCEECTSCGSSIPEVGKTTVTLVGTEEDKGSYYEVEVPATMAPGQTAPVSVEGTWKGSETLKVTAPKKVTLYYGNQSIDVAIDFAGINAAGNDLADCSATANLKLADATVKFGTWTGVIEYNVELIESSVGGGENPDNGDVPNASGGGSN